MNVTLSISPHPQRPKCSNPSPLVLASSSNYRPAVILPGLGNNSGDYNKLEQTLNSKYGVPTVVAKVSRLDWFRNAAGLLDTNYWRGTLQPRPVLDWYLKRVHDAVQEAKELAQGETLSLIGHSAGGWLARVYMEEFGLSHISLLLTLGTPHLPPPKGVSGVIDQTRGLLDYVEKNCSKAVYSPQLKSESSFDWFGEVTLDASLLLEPSSEKYIEGARIFGKSNPNVEAVVTTNSSQLVPEAAIMNTASTSPPNTTLRARFVGQGYKQVCGQADVWGDGVVPEVSAHLEGALNICLDGVYHSPVGSDDALRPWYGSPDVLEQWVEHLLN
ncbi:GPI inositol-deacylase PGAP1-like [Sesbania bispinosa]|nr:GPI inositol-deacylase PGAP1-like [Sesbania bispinosa]